MAGYIGNIPTPQATQSRQSFTATASQTTFATIGYTPNFLDVYLNGVHLLDGTDYTATNGSDVVLTVGAAVSDVVEVISYETFAVLDQTFTGTTTVTDSGAAPLVANRTTSDGNILDLHKDGVAVGSIGSKASAVFVGTGDTGVRFDASNNQIRPWNTSTNAISNGNIGLGSAGGRFKDLYLSGGVYLGGTGSANKLEDYEEGTWTPTSAVGLTINYANYTKVGRLVFINVDFSVATTSSTAELAVSLPFGTADAYGTGSFNYQTTAFTDAKVYLGTTGLSVRASASGGNLSYAQVSASRIILSATYRTS